MTTPPQPSSQGLPAPVRDFLFFRSFLLPKVIQVVYWIAIAVVVVVGIVEIFHEDAFGDHHVWQGILTIVLGPLAVRLYAELMLLLFRIYDVLVEIRDQRRPV